MPAGVLPHGARPDAPFRPSPPRTRLRSAPGHALCAAPDRTRGARHHCDATRRVSSHARAPLPRLRPRSGGSTRATFIVARRLPPKI